MFQPVPFRFGGSASEMQGRMFDAPQEEFNLFRMPDPLWDAMFLEAMNEEGIEVLRSVTTPKPSSTSPQELSVNVKVVIPAEDFRLRKINQREAYREMIKTPMDASIAFFLLEVALVSAILLMLYVWLGQRYAELLRRRAGSLSATQRVMKWAGNYIFHDNVWGPVIQLVRAPILLLSYFSAKSDSRGLSEESETEEKQRDGGLALPAFIAPDISIIRQGYEPVI